MDVVCIGLMVCDIIAKPIDEAVFKVDATNLESLKIASGGDALNAAINMARLGLKVGLVGKVGNDALGEFLIAELNKYGVDSSTVIKTDEYPTSTSIAMVDASGERHFAYYGKANNSLIPEDIEEHAVKSAGVVHLGSAMALDGLDGQGLAQLFMKARKWGALTSMDVTWDFSGRWLDKIKDALYYTDVFMPSLNEAKMISGCETPEQMRAFFGKYPMKVLAVKLGPEGCYVTDMKHEYYIDAFNVPEPVDTTGAGDAFVSGFLAGIVEGRDIYTCGLLGNAAASFCVTELGATSGVKSMQDVLRLVRQREQGAGLGIQGT